jgi:hypothetical protein
MDYLAHLELRVEMEEMERAFSPQLSPVHKAHAQMVELDLLIQMEAPHLHVMVQVDPAEVLDRQDRQDQQDQQDRQVLVAVVELELAPELWLKVHARQITLCISA